MNIRIPHSWLKEYLPGIPSPKSLAKSVSCSGPSVEHLIADGSDTIYDIEITTNRPDAFSIVGFAREVAAILGLSFKDPLVGAAKKSEKITSKNPYRLTVSIKDNTCRRYQGVILDNVEVGPSPKFIQARLAQCGLRPINNVVDITNYVMLEYGQPLHAFDADKICALHGNDAELFEKHITVRQAKKGEVITTLDGEKKVLQPTMTVIADDTTALAIAGIKGGNASGIDENTNTIILEAASFDPVATRTAARVLDLRTDASLRFEKDLDPAYTDYALNHAMQLLKEHCNATIATGLIDVWPKKQPSKKITMRWDTYTRVIGLAGSPAKAVKALSTLGFSVTKAKDSLKTVVPFWRSADIEGERDIVEEIARMEGYHTLPHTPLAGSISLQSEQSPFAFEEETKKTLRDIGFSEVYTYSMVSKKLLEWCAINPEKAIAISNPLSAEFEYLRTSLLPGLLFVAAENEQKKDALSLFEMSTVFHSTAGDLPKEQQNLCLVSVSSQSAEQLYLQLKGSLELLFGRWFSEAVTFKSIETDTFFSAGQSATIMVNKVALGTIGVPHKKITTNYGIKKNVVMAELSLEAIMQCFSSGVVYHAVPKFPPVLLDIAFVISRNVSYADLITRMYTLNPLITHIELFDVFRGKTLAADTQSLAFHISYSDSKRTLTAQEVADVHATLVATLQKEYNITLRS